MASQITNYKCPACTGPLHYSPDSGMLECDYCLSRYDVATIEALYAEKEKGSSALWDPGTAGSDWGEDAEKMRAYSCPSCGAEIICDDTTAATSCPYCGNTSVIPGKFEGSLRPDFVIPFRYTREDAVKALRAHYKGKLLLPGEFRNKDHIEEIRGVYVPFWLFDGEADASMSFHATRSYTHKEGDYKVITTEHYDVFRSGNISFEKVPVDGSSRMPDDLMDSVEPYDYSGLKGFSTAYLPGFFADRYDVSASQAAERADMRCRNSAVSCIMDTVSGYETVDPLSNDIRMEHARVSYALMPVWMLSTKWKDKNYIFAMNGQTGKMAGDLPCDKKKLRIWFWSVAIGTSAVLSILFSGPLGDLISRLLA